MILQPGGAFARSLVTRNDMELCTEVQTNERITVFSNSGHLGFCRGSLTGGGIYRCQTCIKRRVHASLKIEMLD